MFIKVVAGKFLSNRGGSKRLGQITEAVHIPPHPPKVKTPRSIRLYEKIGIRGSTCLHCKKESLEIIYINFALSINLHRTSSMT